MGLKTALFLGVILCASAIIPSIQAYNPVAKHSVGIVLSNTCLTMIKHDIDSECPTYADLHSLDNSNTAISGVFGHGDKSYFHRHDSQYENSWRFYDFDGVDNFRIFVDPPKGMHDKIKLITIHPNLDTYKMTKDTAVHNYTRIVYHDRYIDDSCKFAQISAKKWEKLLPDTIFVIRENCDPQKSNFSDIEYIPIKLKQHDIETSYKWKHDEWIKKAKECAKVRGCDLVQEAVR